MIRTNEETMFRNRDHAIAQLNRWYVRLMKRPGWGWDRRTLAVSYPDVYNSLQRLYAIAQPYRED